jgi:hypothetical protein
MNVTVSNQESDLDVSSFANPVILSGSEESHVLGHEILRYRSE